MFPGFKISFEEDFCNFIPQLAQYDGTTLRPPVIPGRCAVTSRPRNTKLESAEVIVIHSTHMAPETTQYCELHG